MIPGLKGLKGVIRAISNVIIEELVSQQGKEVHV